MAMHTDAALRFPAWLIAASVVVGVALGLWQVGVFDRSTHGGSGASAMRTQASCATRRGLWRPTSGGSRSPINRVRRREAERPTNTIDQLAGEPDPEVRAESDALQAALAAEQASH